MSKLVERFNEDKWYQWYPKYVVPADVEANHPNYYETCVATARTKGWLKTSTAVDIAKDETVHPDVRQAFQKHLELVAAGVDEAPEEIKQERPSPEDVKRTSQWQETREELQAILEYKRIPKEVRTRLQALLDTFTE